MTRLVSIRTERRAWGLAAIIMVQALAAVFFIADVIADFHDDGAPESLHTWIELAAALALVAGVLVLMRALGRMLADVARLESGLRAARGEMAELIDAFFTEWGLTPSERDVALMILKGLDNETIASLRGTAPGTVRAQATAIYGKAGVDGRAQLFSVFMEELLAGPEAASTPASP